MVSTVHDIGTFTALSTLVATVYALLKAFSYIRTSVKGQKLPPGPAGVPLLGAHRLLFALSYFSTKTSLMLTGGARQGRSRS